MQQRKEKTRELKSYLICEIFVIWHCHKLLLLPHIFDRVFRLQNLAIGTFMNT